ncbi:MAG: PCI domain-containing protein [Candidatus Thorarchaeota archaeon]
MNPPANDEIAKIESQIKDLDLDYMRGLVSEEEYNKKLAELKQQLGQAGGAPQEVTSVQRIEVEPSELRAAKLHPPSIEKKATVDPVSAVKRTVEGMRRLALERIAQEAGVSIMNVTKILSDLLDGRELSGRIDHDRGDFILGTGSGPPPKTVAVCPFCRSELKRIAVRGETVTCTMCKESFIIS